MRTESKTVHSGDRRKPGKFVPVTTPIYTAASYVYDSMDQLDRVMGQQEPGPSYSRFENPTRSALEELVRDLENGHGATACSSGMSALHLALFAAMLDRPRRVLAADALYGTSKKLLMNVFGPTGVETTFFDACNADALERSLTEAKPGVVFVETMSNPLLRVCPLDRVAEATKRAGAALVVDNTFATPLLVRPLELGANIVIHSATKYLSGHGDVLGGVIVSDQEHYQTIATLSRTMGPVMSPFDCYLVMRGIKTLALRLERQCANACKVATWLAAHPRIDRVYFAGDPAHPDAETIERLCPKRMHGGIVAFEIKEAGRAEVFRFMQKLGMIVRAVSLGDVNSMVLYPAISSHRDMPARLDVKDNLVRISVGIEAIEDILADLDQALE